MVPSVSRKTVVIAGVVLIVLAAVGAYRGFRTSTTEADVAASSESLAPTANAVAARQASALQEPAPAALSEAQIRTIARQEAQAALAGRNAPASSGSGSSEPSSPSPAPRPPAASSPAPQPAPPPAPAGEANQPPLF